MQETRTALRNPTPAASEPDEPHQVLRELGARAHQLRAATRAADHYNGQDAQADIDTGAWLISSALEVATEVTGEIDALARGLKEKPADATLQQRVAALRVRSHQLHAAIKAADHFLDQDTREDRETGSWLIAAALSLAHKFASELDDNAAPAKRAPVDKSSIEPHDAALTRRVAAATAPLRGAA